MATVPSHAPARCTIDVPTVPSLRLKGNAETLPFGLGTPGTKMPDHAASPNSALLYPHAMLAGLVGPCRQAHTSDVEFFVRVADGSRR